MWRPLQLTPDAVDAGQRGARYLRCIGRLKQGVSFQQARKRIEDLGRDMARKFPNSNEGWTASVTGLQDYMIRKVREALWVLLGAVGFVLLIAIVNVANLFLVHAAHRQSEVAIRTALGAGRGRLVRQFLVEGLLLTTAAGILGCLGAFWLTDLVRLQAPRIFRGCRRSGSVCPCSCLRWRSRFLPAYLWRWCPQSKAPGNGATPCMMQVSAPCAAVLAPVGCWLPVKSQWH